MNKNLAILSENYRTFPKVGPHYKEKASKLLVRSDNSLRPNSCVLFETFVARRKKYRAVIWIRKLRAQLSQNRILVIIKHLASYKIGDSFTFENFSTAYTLTGALYGRDAKTWNTCCAIIQTSHFCTQFVLNCDLVISIWIERNLICISLI